MEVMIGMALSSLGGTAAVGATAAAGATAAVGATAATGISLSTVLQGVTGVMSMMASISAGNQEADMFEAQAIDAAAQKPLETLNGIDRRTSIKKELMQSIGDQDTAYAASGVELSFGTPGEARKDAYADADRAITAENATQSSRTLRLDERAKNYKLRAKRAKSAGVMDALTTGFGMAGSFMGRG